MRRELFAPHCGKLLSGREEKMITRRKYRGGSVELNFSTLRKLIIDNHTKKDVSDLIFKIRYNGGEWQEIFWNDERPIHHKSELAEIGVYDMEKETFLWKANCS